MFTHRHFTFLVAISLTALALFAQETPPVLPRAPQTTPPATTPSAAAPVAPPSDPFVRSPGAPKKSEVAAPPAAVAPVNLLTTLETWSLSQTDFVAILDGPADDGAPYARIEELAKTGKAKLLGLIALSTKHGQRAEVESIDEVRYATEFDPGERAGDIAFPTAWQTRNTGDALELEPILGPDGKRIDVNLVPSTVRLGGFEDWKPEAVASPQGQPKFYTEKVTTSLTVQSGRPAFLSTSTPAVSPEGQSGKELHIQFLRVAAQPAPPSSAPVPVSDDLRIEFLLYTLDRAAARRILVTTADSAQSHAAVRESVAKGEAQLEVVRAFVTKTRQRAVSEEIAEISYPSEVTPPTYASQTTPPEGRQPASFSNWDRRNTGLIVEVEPVIDPTGRFVDINIVPQVVRLAGMLKVEGIAAKYPPQPVFTTRKVTTSLTSGLGVPVLLGTLSKPRDNGVNDRKDDGQTSLAYIRVTPVRP